VLGAGVVVYMLVSLVLLGAVPSGMQSAYAGFLLGLLGFVRDGDLRGYLVGGVWALVSVILIAAHPLRPCAETVAAMFIGAAL